MKNDGDMDHLATGQRFLWGCWIIIPALALALLAALCLILTRGTGF